MKIATWNINSIKVRLPQVLDWLATHQPDVLCLQETKTEDRAFPFAEIEAAGYQALHFGQKTYNGVAILSRTKMNNVVRGIPNFDDPQARLIAATLGDMHIICAYFPNGQAVGSEKYEYKLQWLAALTRWLREELSKVPPCILLGDFNIAPEDRDIYDPVAWKDQILCSEPERDAFRTLLNIGLTDAFRLFDQPEKSFTWWDYRMMGYQRNRGIRLDHILLSSSLTHQCTSCTVDKTPRGWERPSDHAPVMAEFAIHD